MVLFGHLPISWHVELIICWNGVDYISLYGKEPGAIEAAFAIYANVIELDDRGQVTNARYAEKRATDYIKSYFDSSYKVVPEFEEWETTLHSPPPLKDMI